MYPDLTENEIDATREFMLTFFMEDDTVQVFEDTKRNSGNLIIVE